jgi:hypothetical protein
VNRSHPKAYPVILKSINDTAMGHFCVEAAILFSRRFLISPAYYHEKSYLCALNLFK